MPEASTHGVRHATRANFGLGGSRTAPIRVDMFNALDTVVYTGGKSTLQLANLTNQTIRNVHYLAGGQLNPVVRSGRESQSLPQRRRGASLHLQPQS